MNAVLAMLFAQADRISRALSARSGLCRSVFHSVVRSVYVLRHSTLRIVVCYPLPATNPETSAMVADTGAEQSQDASRLPAPKERLRCDPIPCNTLPARYADRPEYHQVPQISSICEAMIQLSFACLCACVRRERPPPEDPQPNQHRSAVPVPQTLVMCIQQMAEETAPEHWLMTRIGKKRRCHFPKIGDCPRGATRYACPYRGGFSEEDASPALPQSGVSCTDRLLYNAVVTCIEDQSRRLEERRSCNSRRHKVFMLLARYGA